MKLSNLDVEFVCIHDFSFYFVVLIFLFIFGVRLACASLSLLFDTNIRKIFHMRNYFLVFVEYIFILKVNNMSTVKDNLLSYLQYKNMTTTKLEGMLGLSRGAIKKTQNLGSESLRMVLQVCPDLSAEWLLTGKGEMTKSQPTYVQSGGVGNSNIQASTINKVESSPVNLGANEELLKELREIKGILKTHEEQYLTIIKNMSSK